MNSKFFGKEKNPYCVFHKLEFISLVPLYTYAHMQIIERSYPIDANGNPTK